MKKFNRSKGQGRAKVTIKRKGKDRNDTSDFEFPDNAAGRLAVSFWGFIVPQGFRSPTLGAGALRAAQRRYAEQFNRDHRLPTHRDALNIEKALEGARA